MINMATLVMKFQISVEHSLLIIRIKSLCPLGAPESRRRFLKKYITPRLFTPKLGHLRVGRSWNLQFPVSFSYKCNIPNLVEIGPAALKKLLTDHGPQRTQSDGNRLHEWLKWYKNEFTLLSWLHFLIWCYMYSSKIMDLLSVGDKSALILYRKKKEFNFKHSAQIFPLCFIAHKCTPLGILN